MIAKVTWVEVLKWWNIHNVQPDSINDVITLANLTNLSHKLSMVFDAVVFVLHIYPPFKKYIHPPFKKKKDSRKVYY